MFLYMLYKEITHIHNNSVIEDINILLKVGHNHK